MKILCYECMDRNIVYLWCLIAPLLFDIFLALDCLGSQAFPSGGAEEALEGAGDALEPILWVTLALGTLVLSWKSSKIYIISNHSIFS